MALVKCKSCKKEISSTAKFCPHCGESNIKVYCRECGKEMGINDSSCSNCGYIVNQNEFNNHQPVDTNKGEKYELALIGLIPFSTVTSNAAGIAGIDAAAPILASGAATAREAPPVKGANAAAIIDPAKESTATVPDIVLAVPQTSPNFFETASRFVNASIKEFNSVGSL